jgi:hypothetical protein
MLALATILASPHHCEKTPYLIPDSAGNFRCGKAATLASPFFAQRLPRRVLVTRGRLRRLRPIQRQNLTHDNVLYQINGQDEGDSVHPAGCFESGCIDDCGRSDRQSACLEFLVANPIPMP